MSKTKIRTVLNKADKLLVERSSRHDRAALKHVRAARAYVDGDLPTGEVVIMDSPRIGLEPQPGKTAAEKRAKRKGSK